MKKIDLIYLLRVLYKWKMFLIIGFICLSIISVGTSLIVPLTFSSSATIIPPGGNSLLSSILPTSMTKGLGGLIGGAKSDPESGINKLFAILKSRDLAEKVIEEFSLMEKYGTATMEDAIMAFNGNLSTSLTEESTIAISFKEKTAFFHPDEDELEIKIWVKDIMEFIVAELDKKYSDLETQKARFERITIEKRYNENIEELEIAEQNFKIFSETYGIINLPMQVEVSIKAISELEYQMIQENLKLELLKNSFSFGNEKIVQQEFLIQRLKKNIETLKLEGSSIDSMSIMPSFSETPQLALTYVRLERELLVQNTIYELLTQQYEQIKIQETKDTPSIQFIDYPQIPEKRSSPRRALLVILMVGIGAFLLFVYIIIKEIYRDNREHFKTLFSSKEV